MAELGPDAPAAHEQIGRLAGQLRFDGVVVVGGDAAPILQGLQAEGADGKAVATPDEAVAAVSRKLQAGDAVLVKASRAAGLEAVAEALLRGQAPA
jgi:UDP-N-acetylmuramoyl-tripeptide--D-alanyl-D-alanine ligase